MELSIHSSSGWRCLLSAIFSFRRLELGLMTDNDIVPVLFLLSYYSSTFELFVKGRDVDGVLSLFPSDKGGSPDAPRCVPFPP